LIWRSKAAGSPWDLTALLNAAEGLAGRAQRNLWMARLLEWLRHAPRSAGPAQAADATPAAVLRLRHLLNVLEKNPDYQVRLQRLFTDFWLDMRSAGLFSDFGFGPRTALYSEVWERLRQRVLPTTPDTRELAELFPLLFRPEDARWIGALDAATLARLGMPAWRGVGHGPDPWRAEMMEAVTYLVSAVHAAGFAAALRKRMSDETLVDEPFRQLPAATERLREAVLAGDLTGEAVRQHASYLRALLDSTWRSSASRWTSSTRSTSCAPACGASSSCWTASWRLRRRSRCCS
jgi:site-specific recombinase